VLHPPYDEALIALAGHPPFVLASPTGEAVLVDAPPGAPLGLWLDRPEATRVPVTPGSVLVGYTDGLIERRTESIDVGIERLRRAVVADRPSRVCTLVMEAAVGGYVPEDDIAVIALRRMASAAG
jgi:serine phosphatase RsbU (regulator of sigma subunit)